MQPLMHQVNPTVLTQSVRPQAAPRASVRRSPSEHAYGDAGQGTHRPPARTVKKAKPGTMFGLTTASPTPATPAATAPIITDTLGR